MEGVAALLRWYVEQGVDETIGEEPIDRFAAPPPSATVAATPSAAPAPLRAPTPLRTTPPPSPSRAPVPIESPQLVEDARALAAQCSTLAELETAIRGFEGCALKRTAKNTVFADGKPDASVMVVGEAPGADEDRLGKPFVGVSGQLMDRMMSAIGLTRDGGFYITNILFWRPPGNRTPTPQETQICLPFIQRQIELVDPDVLVTLGNPSTQTLLSTREGIMKTRGRWFDYDTGSRTIRALPTFHPAYLLRSPSYKRLAWQDLRAIAKALAG